MFTRVKHKSVAPQRGGVILVIVIIVLLTILALLAGLLWQTRQEQARAQYMLNRAQAFILAESGIAKGLWELSQNQNFDTDLAYSGATANIKEWIIKDAVGLTEALNTGAFKLVKEAGKERIFALGYLGASPQKATARVLIRQDYTWNPTTGTPLRTTWQEIK